MRNWVLPEELVAFRKHKLGDVFARKVVGVRIEDKIVPERRAEALGQQLRRIANRRVIRDEEQRTALLNPVKYGIAFRLGERWSGIVIVVRQIAERVGRFKESVLCMNVAVGLIDCKLRMDGFVRGIRDSCISFCIGYHLRSADCYGGEQNENSDLHISRWPTVFRSSNLIRCPSNWREQAIPRPIPERLAQQGSLTTWRLLAN